MPEYSSTTITPSDGVQVPGMNGSTSGNFLLSALKSYILSEKGLANGLASLDGNGKLLSSQLPDLADDVIVVASYATLPATGTAGKLYITADNNKMYRWDPDLATPDYVELSIDLSAYATKAELAAEESARETEDSRLKDAIRKDEARITNLEEKADPTGAYKTVYYRGTNDVPSGKAKYALVESIVGKSRAWNQLFGDRNRDVWNVDGLDIVYNSTTKKYTFGGTYSGTGGKVWLDQNLNPQAHEYLIFSDNPLAKVYADSSSGYTNYAQAIKFTANAGWSGYYGIALEQGVSYTGSFAICMRDLTLIFPEGVPSTIAECVAKCPDILKYDPYGYSLVDTTVEGVESRSINVVDQSVVLNVAGTSESDGFITMTSVADVSTYLETNLSWSDFKANTQYTFSWIGKNGTATYVRLYVVYTDGTSDDIATIDSTSATAMSGVSDAGKTIRYVRLARSSNGSFSFKELMVNEGTTAQPYIKYGVIDTLSLPQSVTLRSAGSVAEVYDLDTGEKTNPLSDDIALSNIDWYKNGDYWFTYDLPLSLTNNNAISNKLMYGGYASGTGDTSHWYWSSGGYFEVYNPSASSMADVKTALAGVVLRYVLSTPDDPTQLTPVIDSMIQTEGGGTINTIQTQTPVIDNCMDVGYLAL